MRILIVGASGFTGSYLKKVFSAYEIIGTSISDNSYLKLDLSDKNNIKNIFKKYNPNIICIPAYKGGMDYIEENPQETRVINVESIKLIVDLILKDSLLIYYSSDAVFKGDRGPYSENDTIQPQSEYGKQKLDAEKIVKKHRRHLIIRTCSVYGWDPKRLNFVARLIDTIKENKEFEAPIDQFYTPTYIKDLANATKFLVEINKTGTYHVAGNEFISRYELGKKVCDVFKLKKEKLTSVNSKQLKQIAPRATKGGLKNLKILKEGFKFHTLTEGLQDMLKEDL